MPTALVTVPTAEPVLDFFLFDWGMLFTATAVAASLSRFDVLYLVLRVLYPESDTATRRITSRLMELAAWLAVPLVFSTRIDIEAVFGAGIGALFIAYLVREPLKDKLSAVVTAARVAANDRLVPGVRIRLPGEGIEGTIEDIDTDETHIRLDNGDLTHVPHGSIVNNRWTTVED